MVIQVNNNEFLLEDRIAKIKAINNEYDLENNGYISFSGGKDSTILHYLFDLALPNNHIPRVFFNTGLDFKDIRLFVQELAKTDSRFQIVNSGVNIKSMLNKDGYPFKSKQHAHNWELFKNNPRLTYIYISQIENDPTLLESYEFIHNLPRGIKTNIKYIYGIREKGTSLYQAMSVLTCPRKLQYQFTKEFVESNRLVMSDKCCYRMKKEVAHHYEETSRRTIAITGIRAEEGGMRKLGGCTIFEGNNLHKFHPLKVVDESWVDWFIEKYNIKLCKLYYPPYNFSRTGCVGCPFDMNLQKTLDTMKELLPNEYKKCELIWKPVYKEYRRIGYRLRPYDLFDLLNETDN